VARVSRVRMRLSRIARLGWVSPGLVFSATAVVDILLLGLALAVAAMPRTATFVVEAVTERVDLTVLEGDRPPAWLALGRIDLPPSVPGCPAPALVLPKLLRAPLQIVFDHVDGQTISGELVGGGGSGLEIFCGSGKALAMPPTLSLTWSGELPTLNIDGRTVVGAVPTPAATNLRLLRSGTISVESSSRPFRSGFVRTETRLAMGDEVRVFDAADHLGEAVAHGVLRSGTDGLSLMVRARGDHAEISRVGQNQAGVAVVAPTFWDKVRAQSEWGIVLFCGAVMLNLLAAAQAFAARTPSEP